MLQSKKNLIWIDLEMTGLNPKEDRIIEIATVITDSQINILCEGPSIPIHQEEKFIEKMDEWNRNTHTKNGLIQETKRSSFNERRAEDETIRFLEKWTYPGSSPMCGNSISQDRKFLFQYMPNLERFFHYRHIDVSTIKELVKRWKPDILMSFFRRSSHRALQDVKHSIGELIFYRKHFIRDFNS
ncbi:oligoribonuclease [Candidatus Riesia pediculischaeffi]|uniref:Oligoribonuclease n=1 Tax=Candidatus Riesia pediculischaeffi TaxID=428411 RepID=A0A1V0HKI0_9ENTR|nr:oligoribonuclease [Candidatus Riesia pediculischaeffi]ARC53347.1 oligoribonuclease [Candidatus Riesia pediculischaeffi]